MPVTNKSLSLDELVRANKDQFDRIFNDQMQQANLQDNLESASNEIGVTNESQPSVVSASDSNIVNILNQKFNDDWSHDLIEHTTTGNEVRVVCRLQAGGMSRTHSGTAQVNGNIGIAVHDIKTPSDLLSLIDLIVLIIDSFFIIATSLSDSILKELKLVTLILFFSK